MKNYQTFISLCLVYFIGMMFVYFYRPAGEYYKYLADFTYILAPLVMIVFGMKLIKVFKNKFFDNKSVNYLFYGLALLFIGELYYVYLDLVDNINYPSISDAFFILAYPFFVISILKALKSVGLESKKIMQASLVGLIFFIAYLVLRFIYLQDYSIDNSTLVNVFNILYALGDGIVIYADILLIYLLRSINQGVMFYPWLYILIGFFLNAIADTMMTTFSNLYFISEQNISLIDLIWVLSYLSISIGLCLYVNTIRNTQRKISFKMKLGTYAQQ